MTIRTLFQHFPILFLLSFPSLPAPASAQPTPQKAVDELARSPEMRHAGFGVCVYDVESGRMVAAYQPDLSLIPASILKVVTTASAIIVLGPDYRYSTALEYDGPISGGKLNGNLILRGSGDPTLGSDQLDATEALPKLIEQFRLAIQRKGIREIQGYVLGDASTLPTAVNAPSWQWNDLGNYYAAGAWGLNIHENLYYLRFQQTSRQGERPGIAAVDPLVPGITFQNEVTSAGPGTGDNAYIFGAPYTFDRVVRGTIPAGSSVFTIKGSIPNPPLFAAQHLNMDLEKVGIISALGPASLLDLPPSERPVGDRQTLCIHQSPPLSTIVWRANQKSVNLYCESLLRSIGLQHKKDGSLNAGLAAVRELWQERGLELEGIHLHDGSGLSARNAVTTRFVASILRKAALDQRVFLPLYESFPTFGENQVDLRAKSGTLNRVRAFAGYARNHSGKLLSFAVIVNNFEGSGRAMRRRLEQFMTELCR